MIHAIAEGVTAAFVVAVPVVAVAFGFAWLLREVPLRETGNLTSAVAQSERGNAPHRAAAVVIARRRPAMWCSLPVRRTSNDAVHTRS